ncbi:MAG TPA: serine hydrolase domain-containing protein [Steroidobacteraceae bacterium]|nr:serine hydrolase domain-containing protein [Steroidobacteraceae bacterium]
MALHADPRLALVFALLTVGAIARCQAAESFPEATPESQGLSSQSLAKLLAVVRGFADKGDIVGGELLVIKNRRTVLDAVVGLGDREGQRPLKLDTVYCIRSMTKPVMGAAVQILIDEGRLSLDDTAAKYLPSFDNDKSRGITVRQLLTHTAGLPLSSLLGTNIQSLHSLRDVADKTGNNGPTVPPGTRFQYSDDGADTLGAIVSAITGEPAETFIARRILEPLGMRDTFALVATAGKKLDRFTSAYAGSRGNWVRFWSPQDKPIFPYFLASQGMYSTTKDYARFLAMYLDDGRVGDKRVLSKAAVGRTLTPAIATGMPTGFPQLSAYYGQLMFTYVDATGKLHAFGHSGSDGTWAYAWPDQNLMVLYFTQSRGNSTGLDLEPAIDHLLLGGAEAAPVGQELTAAAAAPYLGPYWFGPLQKPMIVVLQGNRLALDIPWQAVAELKKEAEPNVWSFAQEPGNSLKFQRDGDGLATALDIRSVNTVTLQRLKPDEGLPSLDELFARRGERQRTDKLNAMSIVRMSGTVERTTSQDKGTFELLSAGQDRYRLKVNVNGPQSEQVQAGDRAWIRLVASSPFQPLSETMAKSSLRNGWMLAIGDWRGAFQQARVLKRVELDGKFAYMVLAGPNEGHQRLIYIDAESGLTLGYDQVQDLTGLGMVGSQVRFSDYRDTGGVQIPFKITTTFPTPILGTVTYHVEKLETGLKFDVDPFTVK